MTPNLALSPCVGCLENVYKVIKPGHNPNNANNPNNPNSLTLIILRALITLITLIPLIPLIPLSTLITLITFDNSASKRHSCLIWSNVLALSRRAAASHAAMFALPV